ncbi:MAG: hypothetical protein H6739_36365 [Alphaproteobacteria bacterium]|nr:hypothetical protein [Alphaproteobacteria bacterium]
MSPTRRWLLALPLALVLAFAAPSDVAWAQGGKPPPARPAPAKSAPVADKVDIQLMVVHAKEGAEYVDPRLKNIERHLAILRYNNFTVLDTNRSAVAVGKDASFSVEGGRKVTVTVLSVDDQRARVRVEMYKQSNKLIDTTVSINRGSTMMVAGPRYEEGMLILPITASY